MNWKTKRKSWNSSTCYCTSFIDLCCARFSNVPTSDEGGPPTPHPHCARMSPHTPSLCLPFLEVFRNTSRDILIREWTIPFNRQEVSI